MSSSSSWICTLLRKIACVMPQMSLHALMQSKARNHSTWRTDDQNQNRPCKYWTNQALREIVAQLLVPSTQPLRHNAFHVVTWKLQHREMIQITRLPFSSSENSNKTMMRNAKQTKQNKQNISLMPAISEASLDKIKQTPQHCLYSLQQHEIL